MFSNTCAGDGATATDEGAAFLIAAGAVLIAGGIAGGIARFSWGKRRKACRDGRLFYFSYLILVYQVGGGKRAKFLWVY